MTVRTMKDLSEKNRDFYKEYFFLLAFTIIIVEVNNSKPPSLHRHRSNGSSVY